jgi:ATP-dependent DNA helicase RecQ
MLSVNKEVLYKFEVENKKYELLIRTLLRAYSGIFEGFVTINENEIGKFTDLTREQVIKFLNELQQFHLLQYEPQKDAPQVVFTKPRADSEEMQLNYELLKRRKHAHEMRLTAMKHYVSSDSTCRSQLLLSYFGEEDGPRCGICDVCLRRNKLDLSDLEFKQITEHVIEMVNRQPLSISEIVDQSPKIREQKILQTIRWLLDNEELTVNEKNQLIFRR